MTGFFTILSFPPIRLLSMNTPRIVRLPSLRQDDFLKGLKQLVPADATEAGVRGIQLDRVERAFETGSDRDATSKIWDYPKNDSNPTTRAAHGIANHQVTYLLPVHGVQSPQPTADWGEVHMPLGQAIDGQTDAGKYDAHTAYLVYDAQKIKRAPDAWVEYWLPKEPRQALLGILVAQSAWQPRFDVKNSGNT